MAYIQKTIEAGAVIEVQKYFDWLYGRRHQYKTRRERKRQTPENQVKRNEKKALEKLRWKLNAGCRPGDYHITLTYSGKAPEKKAAAKALKNYLDRLRRLYKKTNTEFRWLAVTEYQNKRIHHHLIVSQGPPLLEIVKRWKAGRPKVTVLDESGDYSALAAYLIKETQKTFRDPDAPCKKRWSCSRNWPKPKITRQVIRRTRWVTEPRAKKGYCIDKNQTENYIDADGFPCQRYVMIKIKNSKIE